MRFKRASNPGFAAYVLMLSCSLLSGATLQLQWQYTNAIAADRIEIRSTTNIIYTDDAMHDALIRLVRQFGYSWEVMSAVWTNVTINIWSLIPAYDWTYPPVSNWPVAATLSTNTRSWTFPAIHPRQLFDVMAVSDGSSVVNLTWNKSAATNVSGYRIYMGTITGTWSKVFDAGNRTNFTVTNLNTGVRYHFAATAYTAAGLESDKSVSVSSAPYGGPYTSTRLSRRITR